MYTDVIGIVGGMGSFATLDLFKRLLYAFPAEKEWDRPRIIIDNRCTMPSRVRAILYGERRNELIEMLADSIKYLVHMGATKIILACNTSHCFLDDIYQIVPEAKNVIVNIIDECACSVAKQSVQNVKLIATEGTIQTKIYNKYFLKYGIHVDVPQNEEYSLQRELIEAVKQNHVTPYICNQFMSLVISNNRNVVLGCTEFPIIYEYTKDSIDKKNIRVFDPLECVIERLKMECR